MNKWLGLLIVVLLLCGGWYVVRNQRVQLGFNAPKTAKIDRGDIRVPIAAAGIIEPRQFFEVKGKASGEVVKIHVTEGDEVEAGQILVELDPDDEQRNRDRAQSDFNIALLGADEAEQNLKNAEATITAREAQLDALKAQFKVVSANYDMVKEDKGKPKADRIYPVMDYTIREADYERNLAEQKNAEALLEQARVARASAELAIKKQAETIDKFKKILEDAQERLADTTIRAAQKGIVTDVAVAIGDKIQSGVTSMTGGTVLVRMADVSLMKVIAKVDEADYGRVANIAPAESLPQMPGMREKIAAEDAAMLAERSGLVKLTVDAFPDKTFEGRIMRVEPLGRQVQGASVIQFNVHVEITNQSGESLPLGAQAQVEFTIESVANALRVPADGVKSHNSEPGVWLVEAAGPGTDAESRKFVPCKFGISDGEYTQIVSTAEGVSEVLKEGQLIYTKLPVVPSEK